jgi:hypothetical protein
MVQGKTGCAEEISSQEEDSRLSAYVEVVHASWEH